MAFDKDLIGLIANGASILTSVIASLAFIHFHWARRAKRVRLEKLLAVGLKRGQPWRTALGLAIELGISETEIIDASYRSRTIVRLPLNDPDGMATGMLLARKSSLSDLVAADAISVACKPTC